MKILPLLAIFCMSLAFAQTSRFIYQVHMKTDSLGAAKVETAFLDVTPKGSLFLSENKLKRDSVMQRMRATGSFSFSQMDNISTSINYTIDKDYAKQQLTYKNRIGRDQYAYTETNPFTWKILNETAKIGDYNTQKAETAYGGRMWYAWFTQDVPVSDGPYKFSGLPGLIVKVEDAKKDYSFDLMQSQKIEEPAKIESFGQVISLKKADYLKIVARYQKDPESFMRSSFSSGGMGGPGGPGGARPPMINSDQIKKMQEKMKQNILENNNPIEK